MTTLKTMTVYEYLQKQVRGVAGGIAWPEQIFKGSSRFTPGELIDTAVDIAWERLLSKTTLCVNLVIEQRKKMIRFRVERCAGVPVPA